MTTRIERTLRVIKEGEVAPKPALYWRARSFEERLAETLKLHREGNELFRGGNPPFVHVIRMRDVDPPR
ncbi:MAG: hypothetical protein J0L88_01160 [Xanthomonadales bacterium]|nr:hypothetical protein [Xanthomonadales bacterium]